MERRQQNPKNRWNSLDVDYLAGEDPLVQIEVHEDASRTALAENDSPDIPFRYSLNPYRGCQHACAYCYARPTHEYLSLGAGTDFDTKIHVKRQAPALLRATFEKTSWQGDPIVFSGVTDCYQPLESRLQLTRACLEVCAEYQNPVGIITKSPLVERDLDVLLRLRERARVGVSISIPFFCPEKARKVEPWVASPQRRLRTIETLARAGISVGVMVAPVIPGLSDEDVVQVLEAAAAAGASSAGYVLLRLPGSVVSVFEQRIRAAFPERADKILHRVKETRAGALYNPRFGSRQVGEGPYADAIAALFSTAARRLNLLPGKGGSDRAHDTSGWRDLPTTFLRPTKTGPQLRLF